ncbi:hypothetical protein MLD38_005942 [Melastoma candidum]|uniref:Uncharacterized protein n=1 Tax=Melastoma candidum TaxID=119954 RepID=A0ACB9RKX2_9MYRT|nr:hypothetical protein MLD38_005942 [Melastoma candidum]
MKLPIGDEELLLLPLGTPSRSLYQSHPINRAPFLVYFHCLVYGGVRFEDGDLMPDLFIPLQVLSGNNGKRFCLACTRSSRGWRRIELSWRLPRRIKQGVLVKKPLLMVPMSLRHSLLDKSVLSNLRLQFEDVVAEVGTGKRLSSIQGL